MAGCSYLTAPAISVNEVQAPALGNERGQEREGFKLKVVQTESLGRPTERAAWDASAGIQLIMLLSCYCLGFTVRVAAIGNGGVGERPHD
jgi:hypothetical protein